MKNGRQTRSNKALPDAWTQRSINRGRDEREERERGITVKE